MVAKQRASFSSKLDNFPRTPSSDRVSFAIVNNPVVHGSSNGHTRKSFVTRRSQSWAPWAAPTLSAEEQRGHVAATHAIQKQISKLEKKVEEMEKLIDYAHHFLSARLEAKNDIGTNGLSPDVVV